MDKKEKTTTFPRDIFKKRRSVRNFDSKLLRKGQLSAILLYSAGITYKSGTWDSALRAYPSAGARYPLEIYPIILKSKEIGSGAYHYNVKENSIELLLEGNFGNIIFQLVGKQEMIKTASAVIVITCIFDRVQSKYGERGYRYAFLEAGHLAQNIYLISPLLGLGCCGIGGFLDDRINSLLDIDGMNESAIYLLALGGYGRE
ncbi:MAG: SagB/ThcOx family dehydrogenase [Candidatus Aenigmarchaeota archaeon]|nr:SagB/ThcOx family dehydrogenase [Candidatus Aenigmarchaeota archaeon]